ncbi:ribitol-5-phosphate transferase FKTN isoform X1 [Gadus morhua]|uniref:ribitol-5-phosphate transferase FKTN isoform X1 n=1 Tax=Gadus morhua TaxID=8049 RepID=UPI0011B50F28|nr:fukutin isoform X1 [Gadus morhua]XP_030197083.1 fukutin isoform X1 [Gadus morhua]
MPRLNKTGLLAVLVAASSAFLLFQLYYYRQSSNGGNTSRQKDNQWEALRRVMAVARKLALPIFLADPTALSLIGQTGGSAGLGRGCSFLCTGRPVTAFAAIADHWKYDRQAVATVASQKGLEVEQVRGRDPRLLEEGAELSAAQIPLHFLFRSTHGHIVQVVLLYQRSGGYLWHAPLRLAPSADRRLAPPNALPYGRHAGAYRRPDLVLTMLDGLDVQVPRNSSHFLTLRSEADFIECRHKEARAFYQLYPEDGSVEAAEFRRAARSVLSVAARTLDSLNVPFWISSGTCLGWYRQCGFISYSRDVDVGVSIRHYRPDLATAFASAGLPLKHSFGRVEDSLELSFQSPGGGVKLDVFFFYQEESEGVSVVWNGGTQAKSGRKFKLDTPVCRSYLNVWRTCLPTCLTYLPVFLSQGMCFLVLNSAGRSWRACVCVFRARPWTMCAPTTGTRRGRPRRPPGTGRPRPPT